MRHHEIVRLVREWYYSDDPTNSRVKERWRSRSVDEDPADLAVFTRLKQITSANRTQISDALAAVGLADGQFELLCFVVGNDLGKPSAVTLMAMGDSDWLADRVLRIPGSDEMRVCFDSFISVAHWPRPNVLDIYYEMQDE